MTPPKLMERAMFLEASAQPGDTALSVKWRIRIDAEQMYVVPKRKGKIQEHLEVIERGAHGTTPATHLAGATVLFWDSTEGRWWDDGAQGWTD